MISYDFGMHRAGVFLFLLLLLLVIVLAAWAIGAVPISPYLCARAYRERDRTDKK